MKKVFLYFKWIFDRTKPYACTFQAYLDKLEVDKERKKARQPSLKDRIKNYRKAGKKA